MSENPSTRRLHPLLATAAVSVILASGVGIAAMAGWLPNSNGAGKNQSDLMAGSASQASLTPISQAASNAAMSSPQYQPSSQPSSQQSSQMAAANQSGASHQSGDYARSGSSKPVCQECGVVESVQAIEQHPSSGSGVGAVAGALLGGVLGNQVGGGNGQKLATVAGAVGGGFAGNAIEKKVHTTISYDVHVKMDNGQRKTVHLGSQPAWQAGDRVRLVHGNLQAG